MRKAKIRRDERAALRVCHHLARGWIDQSIGVEKKPLSAEREIVNRPQQCAVVENSGAAANHGLARFEWIVCKRQPRPKVISVAHDAFVFPTQAVTQHEVRSHPPFILREDAGVGIVLRRGR